MLRGLSPSGAELFGGAGAFSPQLVSESGRHGCPRAGQLTGSWCLCAHREATVPAHTDFLTGTHFTRQDAHVPKQPSVSSQDHSGSRPCTLGQRSSPRPQRRSWRADVVHLCPRCLDSTETPGPAEVAQDTSGVPGHRWEPRPEKPILPGPAQRLLHHGVHRFWCCLWSGEGSPSHARHRRRPASPARPSAATWVDMG